MTTLTNLTANNKAAFSRMNHIEFQKEAEKFDF